MSEDVDFGPASALPDLTQESAKLGPPSAKFAPMLANFGPRSPRFGNILPGIHRAQDGVRQVLEPHVLVDLSQI